MNYPSEVPPAHNLRHEPDVRLLQNRRESSLQKESSDAREPPDLTAITTTEPVTESTRSILSHSSLSTGSVAIINHNALSPVKHHENHKVQGSGASEPITAQHSDTTDTDINHNETTSSLVKHLARSPQGATASQSTKDRSSPEGSSEIPRFEKKTQAKLLGQSTKPTRPNGEIRRITSDAHPHTQRYHISVPTNGMPAVEELDLASNESQSSSNKFQIPSADLYPNAAHHHHDYDGQPQEMQEGAHDRTRTERSVSRGRVHMDKSIEATVKKPESSGYVRSRKASHMMGIFDAKTESYRRDHDDQRAQPRNPLIHDIETQTASPGSPPENARVTPTHVSNGDYFSHARSSHETAKNTPRSEKEKPKLLEALHRGDSDSLRAGLADDKQIARPAIPRALLDEIKSVSRSGIVPLLERSSIPDLNNHRDIDSQKSTSGDTALHDEGEEEEEEHISAAVYYPHEGPSEEGPDGTDGQEISPNEVLASPVADTYKEEDHISAPSESGDSVSSKVEEHIDISVESQYETSVLHGIITINSGGQAEIDEAQTPRIKAQDEQQSQQCLPSSESELGSSDETADFSQAEDGTRTPLARSPKRERVRADNAAKPKNAVTLTPYKHQVGGHSTMFRFSRRAVCKQLNNRENEFYERIEHTHPDMLKFLPRYIGVLNVTFSRGPKQTDSGELKGDNEKTTTSQMRESASRPSNPDVSSSKSRQGSVCSNQSQPRIVSHSQQLGTMPQVLLNQNRHILPSEYFGLPERPRSADPTHFRQISNDRVSSAQVKSSDLPGEREGSPLRPAPPEHTPSWGTTSVNQPLKDKVLREVFGPPPIKHRRRHGHHYGHNTIPMRKDPDIRRRMHTSDLGLYNNVQSSAGELAQHSSASDDHSNHLQDRHLAKLQHLDMPHLVTRYSSSASEYDVYKNELDKVRTTGSTDMEASTELSRPGPRRRHSGMGLRRRRTSVGGSEKVDLEYFEDEALLPPQDNEVFAMDEENVIQPEDKQEQNSQSTKYSALVYNNNIDGAGAQLVVSTASDQGSSPGQEILAVGQLPVNPEEAQTIVPDQRVAYFILLEDLTSGMGRPCVLDLKMGTRQYGIEANQKKIRSQREKCASTTSQQLGVRICGMQSFDRQTEEVHYKDKYYGRRVKAGKQFRKALTRFLYDGVSYDSVARHVPTILHKLSKLESMIRRLPGYRLYASSLLIYYDAEPEKSREYTEAVKNGVDLVAQKAQEDKPWPPKIEIKLVDFANCVTSEDQLPLTAKAPPAHPTDIDRGYLRGLRTLKYYFERILKDIESGHYASKAQVQDCEHRKSEIPIEDQQDDDAAISDVESDYDPTKHEIEDEGEISI